MKTASLMTTNSEKNSANIEENFNNAISKYSLIFSDPILEQKYQDYRLGHRFMNLKSFLILCCFLYLFAICSCIDFILMERYSILWKTLMILLIPVTFGFLLEIYAHKKNKLRYIQGTFSLLGFGILYSEIDLDFAGPFLFSPTVYLAQCILIILGLGICYTYMSASAAYFILLVYIYLRNVLVYSEEEGPYHQSEAIFLAGFVLVSTGIGASVIFYSCSLLDRKVFFRSNKNKESKRQWKQLLKDLPVGIILTHLGTLQYYNPNVLELLGIQTQGLKKNEIPEHIQQNIQNRITEENEEDSSDDANTMNLANYIFSPSFRDGRELRMKRFRLFNDHQNHSKKSIEYLECRFTNLKFNRKDCLATIIKDQTAYIKLKEEEVAKRQQKMLFYTITHEFRSPLNVIIGLAQVLEKKNFDESLSHTISILKQNSLLLLNLVKDILDLSQMESKTFSISEKMFQIKLVLHEVIQLFEYQAQQSQISLTYMIDPKTPQQIKNDENRYRQILINLISNALKFTRQGFIKIYVEYQPDQQSVLTHVSDSGIGIKPEDKSSLFQLFGKLKTSKKLNPQGVGLGLTICKQLSESMGGTIYFNSEVGKGTTFSFIIQNFFTPKIIENNTLASKLLKKKLHEVKPSKKNFSTRADLNSPVGTPRHGNTVSISSFSSDTQFKLLEEESKGPSLLKCCCSPVLVVDDNCFNCLSISSLLKLFNVNSDTVQSGEEAIDKFKLSQKRKCNHPYKIIFMDFELQKTGINGLEATKQIKSLLSKENQHNCIILGVTGSEDQDLQQKSLNQGMTEVDMKKKTRNLILNSCEAINI